MTQIIMYEFYGILVQLVPDHPKMIMEPSKNSFMHRNNNAEPLSYLHWKLKSVLIWERVFCIESIVWQLFLLLSIFWLLVKKVCEKITLSKASSGAFLCSMARLYIFICILSENESELFQAKLVLCSVLMTK